MSRKRVVVTGLGLISPVGNTVAEGWANILAGKSGIGPVTRFDASAMACQFAGEVKGFKVEDWMPAKEARHMDTFIHYGLAAGLQAVADAGLPTGEQLSEAQAERILNTVLDAGIIIRGGAAKGGPGKEQGGFWTTIVGTINPDHLRDNVKALLAGPLPADLYAEAKRRLADAGSQPVASPTV